MTSNASGPVRAWAVDDDGYIRAHAAEGAIRIAAAISRTPAAVRNRAGILGQRLGHSSRFPRVKGVEPDIALMRDYILAAVEYDTNGGCWLWAHRGLRAGYGRVSAPGFHEGAHRTSWRVFRGPIPDGLWVLHRCDVRLCVNPDHLFLGTPKENTNDMQRKGRGAVRAGEQNTQARLRAADVAEIRERASRGEPYASIASDYSISASTVGDIKYGRSWASGGTR